MDVAGSSCLGACVVLTWVLLVCVHWTWFFFHTQRDIEIAYAFVFTVNHYGHFPQVSFRIECSCWLILLISLFPPNDIAILLVPISAKPFERFVPDRDGLCKQEVRGLMVHEGAMGQVRQGVMVASR
jgi:hypothetical protein